MLNLLFLDLYIHYYKMYVLGMYISLDLVAVLFVGERNSSLRWLGCWSNRVVLLGGWGNLLWILGRLYCKRRLRLKAHQCKSVLLYIHHLRRFYGLGSPNCRRGYDSLSGSKLHWSQLLSNIPYRKLLHW